MFVTLHLSLCAILVESHPQQLRKLVGVQDLLFFSTAVVLISIQIFLIISFS